jgi:hypothetical protein
VLVTVPATSRVSRGRVDREYWRFTVASCRELFGELFDDLEVRSDGNVLACVAFLLGLATEELKPSELAHEDEHFPLIVTVRATKTA